MWKGRLYLAKVDCCDEPASIDNGSKINRKTETSTTTCATEPATTRSKFFSGSLAVSLLWAVECKGAELNLRQRPHSHVVHEHLGVSGGDSRGRIARQGNPMH